MKALLVLGLLALAAVASADCSSTTIMRSDGRVIVCTTCCLGASCAVTCTP